jgi:hypothetical protein
MIIYELIGIMDKVIGEYMVKSSVKKEFDSDIDRLWSIITDNTKYTWRSDLSKIEIIDKYHFIEYNKNNYPTYFTIISKQKYKEYKFNIENSNIKGQWTGIFRKLDNGNVLIEFIEEIETQHFFMKLLLKSYLKKQQKTYIKDLEKVLVNFK